MTIYDDILPARPQHMNEDPHSVWKQCENRACARIFNAATEGMHKITWAISADGKLKPHSPTITKLYCLRCGVANDYHEGRKIDEKVLKFLEEQDRKNRDLIPCYTCGKLAVWAVCVKCLIEFNSIVVELNKKIKILRLENISKGD